MNNTITLGIQIVPKSKSMTSYDLVDVAIEYIKSTGVKYIITPFETVMEGRYEDLMRIADEAQKAVQKAGADECLVYYRIHYRKDVDITFEEKKLDR
jgi:uncharacterized protein YqgV (UPF0045/DUF77 family)